MKNEFEYRIATQQDLEKIWNKNILDNAGDARWAEWATVTKERNKNGEAKTFVFLDDDIPLGEATIILSPRCKPVEGKPQLCSGKDIANLNAIRIDKNYEGKGHMSFLVKEVERFAKEAGIKYLTIGVEAKESRNIAIYFHWGYDKFVMCEIEDDELILYYQKTL